VTVGARATAPTYFMRIFSRDFLSFSAETVVERSTTRMELALVLG
jgi:hypothetical protein